MKLNSTFELEENEGKAVLTPLRDLGELEVDGLKGLFETILDLFECRKVNRLVIDLRNANYFGSSLLGFFASLWQQIHSRGGEMALCNVSDHAEKILKATHLDTLWPLCSSRAAALQSISEAD